jgi:hypothetical protein
VAKAVEVVSRDDLEVVNQVGGKIVEAGGPEGMLSGLYPFPFAEQFAQSLRTVT